jgi:hypothetical protein
VLALPKDWGVVGNMGKSMNYSIGFTTRKGVCLDLDSVSQTKAEKIADYRLSKHNLEGYLLIQSSKNHFHVVFNRYTSWRTTLQIIFSTWKCIEWGVWQAIKGELTLRISPKNGRNLPKIVKRVGKTDKLIRDYLEIYEDYFKIYHPNLEPPTIFLENYSSNHEF